MNKKKLILIIVLSVFGIKGFTQDLEFSQFYANPLYLNPAFAGSALGPRIAVNYRNQWPSIPGAYVTYAASYDQHIDLLSGGLGVQVLYDRAGNGGLATTVGSLMYSYMLRVSKNFIIKTGIEASFISKSIDFSKLTFGDQISRNGGIYKPRTDEPNLPSDGNYKTGPQPDFSAGIIGYSQKFYAGASINHINEPMVSFFGDNNSIIPLKITTHAGLMLPLDNSRNPKNFFSPNIMYQTQQKFSQLNIGAYYIRDYFVAGAWFRQTSENSDAFIILLGIKKESVKIGYSYDLTLSDARFGSAGSHEISLTIELKTGKKEQSIKWRQLPCPIF